MKTVILASIAALGLAGMAAASQVENPTSRVLNIGGGTQIAQSCGSGMNYCAPGSYGPGGCYKPGYANCTAGLVCTGGTIACKPSNGGAAYCYKPGYGTCN